MQLNRELAMISFPVPPPSVEEGQIGDKCLAPAPYDTDVLMDSMKDNDKERQCVDVLTP